MKEENTPNYYAIIPACVRYDNNLTPNAKLLYGEITALCNEKGFCWASNTYFSELYGVSPQAISKWVNSLSDNGYLKLEYEYNGKEIKTRKMYVKEVSTHGLGVSTKEEEGINKRLKGYQQNIKDNNTCLNNKSINNKDVKKIDDEAIRLSVLLSDLHIQNIDMCIKKQTDKQKIAWAEDIERIHRLDGRDYNDIEKLIRHVKQKGQFWGAVIMSGSKLRDKFPTVWAQMNQRSSGYSKPDLKVNQRSTFLDLEE